ncbi:MAG: universal stress protein [Bacteroidia bacterium]|nr:universal stress protein [Bacteroidia bacterium]MDW8235072.1 hypothetical protein [Bacteroidia bacterium]
MGKLLTSVDFGSASLAALQALIRLRRNTRDSLVVYHAYQLPRGMPFLSAHVIEELEERAERNAQKELRDFIFKEITPQERRGIRIYAQREFLTEGLSSHLCTGNYALLALGAKGESEQTEGALGFHTKHFIYHSPVPMLVAFPESAIHWRRILIAYEENYESPVGMSFLRRVIQKAKSEVVGLPILKIEKSLQSYHKKIQKQFRPSSYIPVVWEKNNLVELLLQLAQRYEADVIALFTDPDPIVEGMKSLSPSMFIRQAGWLFLPPLVEEEPTNIPEASEQGA